MSAPSAILHSGCKVNLSLRVGRRLSTGLHELESLFLPLDAPCDKLKVTRTTGGKGLNVAFVPSGEPFGSLPDIPPHGNTLTKAYAWYAGKTGFSPGLDILAHKGVPQGAGLGGGSANAAALLGFLQREAPAAGFAPLTEEELRKGAAAVGSDVPFFLLGGPALVAGVGDTLSPAVNPFAGSFLLLLCPDIAVSTAWAYSALDERRAERGGFAPMENERSEGYVNDFEDLVFSRFPRLRLLHDLLLRSGAELARMSGTGSSLFALYRKEENALGAAKTLASDKVKVYVQSLPA